MRKVIVALTKAKNGSRVMNVFITLETTEGKAFQPNLNFLALSPEERGNDIFPDEWALSALNRLPSHRSPGRPAYVEADRDRLYRHILLLDHLADELGLRSDLDQVFRGNQDASKNNCNEAGLKEHG